MESSVENYEIVTRDLKNITDCTTMSRRITKEFDGKTIYIDEAIIISYNAMNKRCIVVKTPDQNFFCMYNPVHGSQSFDVFVGGVLYGSYGIGTPTGNLIAALNARSITWNAGQTLGMRYFTIVNPNGVNYINGFFANLLAEIDEHPQKLSFSAIKSEEYEAEFRKYQGLPLGPKKSGTQPGAGKSIGRVLFIMFLALFIVVAFAS